MIKDTVQMTEIEDGRIKQADGSWKVSRHKLRDKFQSSDWRLIDNSNTPVTFNIGTGLRVHGAEHANELCLVNTGVSSSSRDRAFR